ncbi:MAG TPA: phytoene/squalene synthase family protein [Terriglobales bacterium]|nr:phytoene/squalene synthase family protein [Terriglobales bacterium]
MNRQLSMAYTVCRGIARAKAKNFYYAFLALPREKRNALCAVYAFMRHADDLSDDPGMTLEQRRLQLDSWADALRRAVAGERGDDPVIMALADTQSRFSIPVELFEQLVYGTTMDLRFEAPQLEGTPAQTQAPYATFDDLYQYCYYVASVVGLVCIRIFGYKDPAAEPLAEKTGIAFQLTNIIRDVKEDASLGRIYLPQEDLARFNLQPQEFSPSVMQNGVRPEKYVQLLSFEAQRAREYYAAAEKLIPMVNEDSRPCLWALVEIYRRLLDKIEAHHYDVFSRKVRLSVPEKLLVLSKGMAKVIF